MQPLAVSCCCSRHLQRRAAVLRPAAWLPSIPPSPAGLRGIKGLRESRDGLGVVANAYGVSRSPGMCSVSWTIRCATKHVQTSSRLGLGSQLGGAHTHAHTRVRSPPLLRGENPPGMTRSRCCSARSVLSGVTGVASSDILYSLRMKTSDHWDLYSGISAVQVRDVNNGVFCLTVERASAAQGVPRGSGWDGARQVSALARAAGLGVRFLLSRNPCTGFPQDPGCRGPETTRQRLPVRGEGAAARGERLCVA